MFKMTKDEKLLFVIVVGILGGATTFVIVNYWCLIRAFFCG
jgi:hypothetical protein